MLRPRNLATRMRSPSLRGSITENTDLVLITVLTSEQAGTDAAWVARRRAALSTHRLLLHPMRPLNPASLFAPWEFCRQPTGPRSAASVGNEYCCVARSTCAPPPPASPS